MARKAISKRVRFEVFKRDSFKCQYCGKSSPDVILHIDHIKPVSKGGSNDVTNLLTACDSCNLGKSNIELDDSSTMAKQKAQLDELSERREQLEMMMEWREQLLRIDDDAARSIADEINRYSNCRSVSDTGVNTIRLWLKKHSFSEIIEAIESSFNRKFHKEDLNTSESFRAFIDSIPKVCAYSKMPKDKQKVFYIKGILRNRVNLVDRIYHTLITQAVELNVDLDSVEELSKTVRNWTEFRRAMEEYIKENSL